MACVGYPEFSYTSIFLNEFVRNAEQNGEIKKEHNVKEQVEILNDLFHKFYRFLNVDIGVNDGSRFVLITRDINDVFKGSICAPEKCDKVGRGVCSKCTVTIFCGQECLKGNFKLEHKSLCKKLRSEKEGYDAAQKFMETNSSLMGDEKIKSRVRECVHRAKILEDLVVVLDDKYEEIKKISCEKAREEFCNWRQTFVEEKMLCDEMNKLQKRAEQTRSSLNFRTQRISEGDTSGHFDEKDLTRDVR